MSTQISERLRTGIKEELSRLLGRGRTAFTCPMDAAQQGELWHELLDQGTVNAYLHLKDLGYYMEYLTTDAENFRTCIEGNSYVIYLKTDGRVTLLRDTLDIKPDQEAVFNALPSGVDRGLFVQWLQNTGIVERDFGDALSTLDKLLDITNTLGQLTRAVPEMWQYLGPEKRDLLRAQKRSSNMPYEWASFDRSLVDNLTFSMAKASLLPVPKFERPFHDINVSRALLLTANETEAKP